MDLKILSNLNFNKINLNKNKIVKNPKGANLKLNQLTKDTFSFTSKLEDPEDLYNEYYDCNSSYYDYGIDSPTGVDYSVLDIIDTKRDKTIPEIAKDAKAGKDIKEYRDALICSRIKNVIKDAKKFTEKHPEFSYDDICQDLIEITIRATDKELEGKVNVPGSILCHAHKNLYFNSLLKKTKENNIPLTEDFEDRFLETEIRDYNDNFVQYFEDKDCKQRINEAINTLTPREKAILEYRFGLNGCEPMTYDKIGEEFNVFRESIRQIEAKALRRLRHPSRSRYLKDLLRS